MTTRYYLDGVEVVAKIRRNSKQGRGGLAGLVRSANGGSPGTGGVIIDDRLGQLDIRGWRPFWVEEDEADEPRIWTGFVNARRIIAMDHYGVGSQWDCDLGDLNQILTLQCWRGVKRKPERDFERIAWMLAHWPAVDYPLYDNGGVSTGSAADFDEADLDGEFPDGLLSNMTLEQSMFFVYRDPTAPEGQENSLFFGPVASARGSLEVMLSNDPDDVDGETCFTAYNGQSLDREPGFTYSGGYLIHAGGKYYEQKEETAETYIRRDKVLRSDRIGKQSTARGVVRRFLNNSDVERDTLTCTVEVRNDQVQLIQEGYRIRVKFTHIPGYGRDGEFHWITIQQLTLRRPDNGNDSVWLVDLEMSNRGPTGISYGGGDPGDFPYQPSLACTEAPTNIFLGSSVAASSIGVEFVPVNPNNLTDGTTATTVIPNAVANPGVGPSTWFGYWVIDLGSVGRVTSVVISYVDGAGTYGTGSGALSLEGSADGSAWTEVIDPGDLLAGRAPITGGFESTVALDATYRYWRLVWTITFASPGLQFFNGVEIFDLAVAGCFPTASPPAPAQQTPWTVVPMETGGGISWGTFPHAYAHLSLEVRVDGVPVSPASIIETDPSCGDFALAWEIDDDETVTVRIQGA